MGTHGPHSLEQRATFLLHGEKVEWPGIDHPQHITIKFENGPVLMIGSGDGEDEPTSVSIVADESTRESWIEKAQAPWNRER